MKDRRNNEDILKAIRDEIKATVNGKIDGLHTKFDEYVKADIEWKEKVDPILGSIEELKTVGDGVKAFKFFGGGAKWIAGVGMAILSIMGFLKYLR